MTKEQAIAMIDEHKNKLVNPVEMLNWTWLRVIIDSLETDEWERACSNAESILSK